MEGHILEQHIPESNETQTHRETVEAAEAMKSLLASLDKSIEIIEGSVLHKN